MNVISPVRPVDPVPARSKWEWLLDVSCRSGRIQAKGSVVEVLEFTFDAPHGEIMDRGYNLLVREPGGEVTVWATFEQCLSRGLLRRVP